MRDLRGEIERLRTQLTQAAERKNYNFQDPAVQEISHRLDRLLNEYHHDMVRKKR